MAGDSGYTTLTHYIHVDVFLNWIESDIKKFIHTYGHKKCGLMHVELCEEIKKIINERKTLILKPMDEKGKQKWNSEWRKKKNGFLKKLFKEEGFIYTCDSNKNANNPSLNQLLSRHIKFCKERDVRKAEVEANPVFSECVKYNSWINTKTTLLTREILDNIKVSSLPTVKKYFSTKAHPQGYYPPDIYRHSKLDCNQYNPPPRSHPKGLAEKAPTSSLHPPTTPNAKQGSKEKNGRSLPEVNSGDAKTKSDANISPKSKPLAPDSQLVSTSKTHPDDIPTSQDTPVKLNAPAPPVNVEGANRESTTIHSQPPTGIPPTVQAKASPKDSVLPPVIRHLPSPTGTVSLSSTLVPVKDTTLSQTPATSPSLQTIPASSLSSGSPSNSFPTAVVTKDQDREIQSSTTLVTSENTHFTQTLPAPLVPNSSLSEFQSPDLRKSSAVTVAEEPKTVATSITSTITTTVTSTTSNAATVTIPTTSTTQNLISSPNQAPGTLGIPQPPTEATPSGTKVISSDTDPQQTHLSSPTPTVDKDTEANSAADASPKPKGSINVPGIQLPRDENQASGHPSIKSLTIPDGSVQKNQHKIDQQNNTSTVQQPSKISVVSPTSDKSGNLVNILNVNKKTAPNDDSKVRINKNDKPNIIPEGITPLKHIIPTLLVILATVTLLFQLYKYTPFGFLLGRRRKRKKRDLRSKFVIHEESTYESPNIALHEWKDHNLVEQTVENDVYIKLLKINRYKQKIQKRKKENKKTLIEVHMEVLEEYKSDEWELHKGDFLEICLRGFINEENETYQNFPNSKLTINNINEKTIEDIQKQDILWNNWVEDQRHILEKWKKEDWFQNLKNKWRNEEQKYKEKNDKLQDNILNKQETHSIVPQKEIWKQWILKQATLIDLFNKEDWFKELVCAQDKEKDNYHINEYNNVTVTTETQLKNEKRNHEYSRSKDIIQKLMVQIHMMVLEECIKEEIIKQKELCIDNFIEDIHNNNNYDEKRNIPLCDTDNSKIPKCEEMHTSRNK